MSYTEEDLPEIARKLASSTSPDEIKTCCAAAAQIAQDLVIPDGQNVVEDVEPLLDDGLLQALMNVVKNCATKHKVAVRNAIRALADISKMEAAKPKLFDQEIFSVLKPYLEQTADHTRQTSQKEVFSYAACTLISNMLAEETVTQMIELDYASLLLRLLKSSIAHRPAVSVFAAAILKQFTAIEDGIKVIVNAGALQTIKETLENTIALLPSATDNKDDYLSVIRFCTYLVNATLSKGSEFLGDVLRLEYPTVLGDCFTAVNTPGDEPLNFGQINPYCVPIVDILLTLLGTEDGESQVTENIPLVPLYYMLLRLSQVEPDEATAQQLSKLALAIGGCFQGDETDEVDASTIITLLNTLTRTYVQADSEVVFIVTSLIVHLANFGTGADAIRNPDSFVTRSVVLKFFCPQEKTEVVQSIIRNECAILNQTVSPSEEVDPTIVDLVNENGMFPLLLGLINLYTELNSEIIETILQFLSTILTSPTARPLLKNLDSIVRTVVSYFSSTNKDDERASDIVSIGTAIINAF